MKRVVSLLIVHKKKDEEIFKHLSTLICSEDDLVAEEYIGTEDGTVNVVRLSEKDYLEKTKNGGENYLVQKRLFIDDIEGINGTEVIFKKYGVFIERVDKDKIKLSVDSKYEWDATEYENFVRELKEFIEDITVDEDKIVKKEEKKQNKNQRIAIKSAVYLLFPPAALSESAELVKAIKDQKEMRRLMLLYGVSKLYYDYLDSFMKG